MPAFTTKDLIIYRPEQGGIGLTTHVFWKPLISCGRVSAGMTMKYSF